MAFSFAILSSELLFRALLRDHLVAHHAGEVVAELDTPAELEGRRQQLRGVELLLVDCDTLPAEALRCAQGLLDLRIVSRVVLFASVPGSYLAHQALHGGFRGVLHKRDSPEVLATALATVLAGGLFVSAKVNLAERSRFAGILSAREISVLSLLAAGTSPARAAKQLRVAPATILTHQRNLWRKLGLRSQREMLVFGLRHGLVSLQQVIGP